MRTIVQVAGLVVIFLSSPAHGTAVTLPPYLRDGTKIEQYRCDKGGVQVTFYFEASERRWQLHVIEIDLALAFFILYRDGHEYILKWNGVSPEPYPISLKEFEEELEHHAPNLARAFFTYRNQNHDCQNVFWRKPRE